MKRLALALVLVAAAATAEERRAVEAEGVAAIRGDVGEARRRAVADALEQAVAQGGLTVESRTDLEGGIVTKDKMSLAATGRLLGHRIVTESRVGDVYQVRIEALVGPEEPSRCAAPLPLHLMRIAVEADPDLDPAVARPIADDAMAMLADALTRAGVQPASVVDLDGPSLRPQTSSSAYMALVASDPTPTAGRLLGGTLRLKRHVLPGSPLTGAPGERLEAVLTLELADAGTKRRITNVAARAQWRLTSRLYDALPLGFQPRQPLHAPNIRPLLAKAAAQVAALNACGPLSMAVLGPSTGGAVVGAGTRQGVRPGDLVRIGEGEPLGGPEDRWLVAEVTAAAEDRAEVRALDPAQEGRLLNSGSAVRLR